MHKYEGSELWLDATHKHSWPKETPKEEPKDEPPAQKVAESPWKLRLQLEQTPHWNQLLRRINEASGPYQMSCGALVDGIVYRSDTGQADYIEDIPRDLFEKKFGEFPRLMMQFRYGTREDINNAYALRTRLMGFASHFLHPVLFFMLPGASWKTNSSRIHLVEDRWTDFAGREEVIGLHHFLTNVEKASRPGAAPPPRFHEAVDFLEPHCGHDHRNINPYDGNGEDRTPQFF